MLLRSLLLLLLLKQAVNEYKNANNKQNDECQDEVSRSVTITTQ